MIYKKSGRKWEKYAVAVCDDFVAPSSPTVFILWLNVVNVESFTDSTGDGCCENSVEVELYAGEGVGAGVYWRDIRGTTAWGASCVRANASCSCISSS